MKHALTVLLLASPLAAQDLFPREMQPVGPGVPGASALLDVTSDGLPDQIVFLFGGFPSGLDSVDSIAVLPGDGRGHFGAPLVTTVPTVLPGFTKLPPPAVFTDLDGDGLVDAALLNRAFESSFGLQFLLGDGAAGWTPSAAMPLDMVPQDLEIADLDADGGADALLHSRDLLRFVPGDGSGGFLPGTVDTALDASAASSADDTDAAVGDIDGDGTLDVLLHEHDWAPEIEWRKGDGHGGFGPRQSIPIGIIQARRLALADFDVDGALDAAAQADFPVPSGLVASETWPFLRVVRGDGHGGFGAALAFLTPPSISELHVADMNGNGRPDLVGMHSGAIVVTLDPLGSGPVDSYGPPFGPSWSPGEGTLALADIDSDGRLDAAMAAESEDATFSARFLGNGQGGFLEPPTYAAPGAQFAQLLETTGDGMLDAVVWLKDGGAARLPGDGAGGFLAPQALPVSSSAQSLAVADFDGNGWPDLASSNGPTHDLSVLLADGQGGFTDTKPGGWPWFAWNQFPGPIRTGDLDGDGLDDLVSLKGSKFQLNVLRSVGGGNFAVPSTIEVTSSTAFGLELGDMDDDGSLDIACARLWLNDGAAHFSAAALIVEPDLTHNPGAPLLGDLDADGHLDVAHPAEIYVAFDFLDVLATRAGDGAGGLGPTTLLETPGFSPARFVDLDGDGVLDLFGVDTAWFGDGAGSFSGPRSWLVSNPDVADIDGDGRPDLVEAISGADLIEVLHHLPTQFTWSDLGHELGGVHGAPQLGGSGALTIGSPLTVHVDALPHDTFFTLILGASQLAAPFKGGLLVPSPDRVVSGLPSGPDGFLSLSGTWPPGLPADIELFLQAWVPDASAPEGWAASGALKLSPP